MNYWLRKKAGKIFVIAIVALIAFAFIFIGVFSPRATRGLHSGAIAGSVNGESITLQEFYQQYNMALEYFKKLGGENFNEELLKFLQIKQMTFDRLKLQKILTQKARQVHLYESSQEIADTIATQKTFYKNDKFDYATYENILKANHLTPHRFEKMIYQDLVQSRWHSFFNNHVYVSALEAEKDYIFSYDTIELQYVLIPEPATLQSKLKKPTDAQKNTFQKENETAIQKAYEEGKNTAYKEQTFEVALPKIVEALYLEQQSKQVYQELIQKTKDSLETAKGIKELKSVLDPYQISIKTSAPLSQKSGSLEGHLEITQTLKDAFMNEPILDMNKPSKTYVLPNYTLVAKVIKRNKANLEEFAKDKTEYIKKLQKQKANTTQEAWIDLMVKQAKVEVNEAVLRPENAEE